ncbi:MAG TPA: thiamine pyrophosphate-dependent enzyme [Candidatus Limnocylindria bacterium]|nr:thiamine pyrophosphate-dependent enzyme [Candidatus Limnocylindria bacterium]
MSTARLPDGGPAERARRLEFGSQVVRAYALDLADRDLPADEDLARSIVPPGTGAARDWSALAPTLPEVDAAKCVGCMACVTACPDTALLPVVLPTSDVEARLLSFAAGEPVPQRALETARSRFADTRKYGDVPEKAGLERGLFGLFVDATKCKGCGECVEVCTALGHKALEMVEKRPLTRDGEGTLERVARDLRFFRTLPPTPDGYRSEKALADLMLGPDALGYVGGAGSCAGCGEGTAIRMLIAATRQTEGPESMAIVAATGCNTVFGSTYPYDPYLVPWTNSLFENAATDAMGIKLRWEQAGHAGRKLWVIGGDGAFYDIGFQALSRMVASGMDIKVLVLDTQVYSNTGGQSSTASFAGQVTRLSAFGKEVHGRPERRKELGRILIAHGDVYVAQTTPAHIEHFYRAILDANSYPGPAVVIAYATCMPEHGVADDAGARQARLAVETRAFPLFTYDPRRGATIAERLSLRGNPSPKGAWHSRVDGTTLDFVDFARSEGRFAPHFKGDEPTPELLASRDDRLANWRILQELAGIDPAAPGGAS